jgi:hypothetical protein
MLLKFDVTMYIYNLSSPYHDRNMTYSHQWECLLQLSCILEFDGACKGNPGKSGAGAIIRRLDGSVVCRYEY